MTNDTALDQGMTNQAMKSRAMKSQAMKNWAGNLDYAASSVHSPSTVGELAEIVASSDEVKALGSRHCFNRIADTQGTHIVVAALDGKPELDVDRGIVRVPGGTSYGELAVYLQSNGYALHNMASLPHISVAGAVQTGTHGSGVGNPALSSAVKAIELVRASGEIERLEAGEGAGGDEFLGSVVGLGALGIVTSLDLAVQPTFDIRQQVFEGLPWDTLLENFDAAASSAYSVSFFTDYYGDTIGQVWRKALASEGQYLPKPVAEEFFGAPAATRPRHPLPEMPGENCTEQLDVPGPWLDRLPHFRHEFTPSNGDELQSEYLLPREHAAAALAEMRSMADKLVPLLYVSEIRTVAADDFWLSPSYQQDSVAIHLTWKPRQPEVEAVLPEIEERLAPFGARPHWGKLFDADAGFLEQLYPRFADFRSLAEKHDPQGKFRNAYLERVILGG